MIAPPSRPSPPLRVRNDTCSGRRLAWTVIDESERPTVRFLHTLVSLRRAGAEVGAVSRVTPGGAPAHWAASVVLHLPSPGAKTVCALLQDVDPACRASEHPLLQPGRR